MPKRTDLRHVLVIGSGPIVIGQACEFDYSGTQACRVLKAEGLRVSLVNSNPATIMTDPEFADATYVEPLTAEFVEKVIARERPDALLPTLGGQTALNIAVELAESGVLDGHGVRLIGADVQAIRRGEDRERFKETVRAVGGDVPRSAVCHTLDEVLAAAGELGYPVAVKAVTRARQAKTEAGGMALDVHGEGELRTTLARMGGALGERLWPAVVQPMVDPGLDMAISVTLSPLVGPVVSFGAGGVATDVAPARLHVLPLTDLDARRFVGGSSLAPYLGDRSRDVLEDLLLRVGALVEGIPEVVGLELNPVIVSPAGASIVDARLRAATVERDPVPPVRRI